MQYQPPAIIERRELVGRLGEPSGAIPLDSDRDVKSDIERVRWVVPTVEDRRDVQGSLGRSSLIRVE